MLGVREEGEGGEKSAAMLGRCWASLENGGRGDACEFGLWGEGSGGLVELFGGVVGGGDLVVGVVFGPK